MSVTYVNYISGVIFIVIFYNKQKRIIKPIINASMYHIWTMGMGMVHV